tara:strand:- start:18 stop:311 length:294 start_codon:yes stop_codon:yes gene_type:complete
MTIKKKLKKLSNTQFSVGTDKTFIELYPCSCCGDPMLMFGRGESPSFNEDISTIKGIKAANAVWNVMSNIDEMTTTNFVDFLLSLQRKSKKDLVESK